MLRLMHLLGVLFALVSLSAGAAAPKRVLVVHSFGNAAPPFTTASIAFESTLAREMGESVDLDEVYLDVARYAILEMEEALVEFMRKRQAKWQPDLVVTIGSPAGIFVAQHRDRLFPKKMPVIYAAMDQRRLPSGALQANATFYGDSFDLSGAVEDILQIAPDTTNIVVVIGASELEKFWTDVLRREYQIFTNRVSFTWFNDLSFDQMLERSAKLPPHSFMLLILLIRDAAGVNLNADRALRRMHEVANAPINGLFLNQLGMGIVGGRLYADEIQGVESARIAVRILHGEPAASVPPRVGPLSAPHYDSRELKRWKISKDRLPPGSTIRFREPTAWERYKWRIVAAVSLFVVEAVLIFVLVANLFKRRRAERSLVESRNFLRAILDTAVEGIITISHSGVIESINAATEKIFGYSTAEMIGQNVGMLMPTLFREEHDSGPGNYLRAHEPKIIGIGREVRGRRKDGSAFPIDLSLSEVSLANGRVFTVFVRDITERRRLEEESLHLEMELAHVARVSILGELSGSLAHELNQPLTAILSNAQAAQRFLRNGSTDLDEVRDILKDIVDQDRRAGEIIQRMRAMLKKGEVKFQPLDLNGTIQEVLAIMRSDLVTRHVTVAVQLSPRLPLVHGDRIQIQQVLMNLIVNGCDAVARHDAAERRVTIETDHDGNGHALVSVSDCGPGIPAGETEKIFEPFYSTKAHGIGMGLAICRSIVTAHGGRLWAANHNGSGALFHFTVPIHKEAKP